MENQRYKKIENNLESYYPKKESELKIIAQDLADGKIFCDRHLNDDIQLIPSVFMILALGGQNWADWMLHAKINFVYEYLDKAGPSFINGYPTFFSCGMLSENDTKKMLKFYEKILEMKKKKKEELDKMELEE